MDHQNYENNYLQEYILSFKVANGSVESKPALIFVSTEGIASNNTIYYIIIIAVLVGMIVIAITIVGGIFVCKRRFVEPKYKLLLYPGSVKYL